MSNFLCRKWVAARHISTRLTRSRTVGFFLFEHVKNRLNGIVFQSREELLAGIREVLDKISVEILERIFNHWMERLEWVSQNNDDYYP
jgi:hypothetical protein